MAIMASTETSEAVQLLHYIEDAAYNNMCDNLGATNSYFCAYKDICDKIKSLYERAALEIAENFKFNSRK